MIAKLIATGPSRNEAIEKLATACSQVFVAPVRTNAWFLNRLLTLPEFKIGKVTTGLVEAQLEKLTMAPEPSKELLSAAVALDFWQGVPFDQTDQRRGVLQAAARPARHPAVAAGEPAVAAATRIRVGRAGHLSAARRF